MPTKTLAEKLKMKPGMRVPILNAPDGFMEQLGPLPDKVEVVDDTWSALRFRPQAQVGK